MELSIVIPVYNREEMLIQTLESLRKQTLQDFAILICDDASTQNLETAATSFPDLHVEYLRFDENAGQFRNVMRGIDHCTTPLVKILHSDDLLFPSALEQQVRALKDHPEAAMCLGGSLAFTLKQGKDPVVSDFLPPFVPQPRKTQQWEQLECFNGYLPSACMFRTEPLKAIGGFNTGLIGIGDWEICVAMAASYPLIATQGPICAYRNHDDQVTANYFFDSDEAILTRDVMWMTSPENPLKERLGLPASQLAHLRHNVAWENLRTALTSPRKMKLLKKWHRFMSTHRLYGPFLLAFPLFAVRKIRRKSLCTVSEPIPDQQQYTPVLRNMLAAP